MNKRGQVTILMGLMVAVFMFFLVQGFITPFSDTIELNRNNMDCSNTSISTGTMITCLGLDMTLWFWIGMVMLAGIGAMWYKKNTGG